MNTDKPLDRSPFSTEKWPNLRVLTCLLVAITFGAVTAVAGGAVSAVLLAATIGSAVTLSNYRVGLWLLVVLTPLSATAIFPREILGITGANPYNALLALTLISFLAEHVWKQRPVLNFAYPRLWWAYLMPVVLAGFVGMTHFSEIPGFVFTRNLVAFTSPTGYLRDVLLKPLISVLLAILLAVACKDGMKFRSVIVAMCLGMWLMGAWVSYYVLSSGVGLGQLASATNREFLGGAGMHANDFGAFAATMLILMVFALSDRNLSARLHILFALTACMSGALLMISFSRGAFLAFAVSLMMFFIVQRRLKTIVAALVVMLALLPLLPAELYERLGTGLSTGGSQVLHSQADPLTAGRVAGVWLPLLAEFQSHPVFGNGLLAVAWSLPLRSGAMSIASINSHNLYLKMLLETGAIGCTLLLYFFWDMWCRYRAAARRDGEYSEFRWFFNGSAAALLGYGAFGFSGGNYLPDPSNSLIWVMWGMVLVVPAGIRSRHSHGTALSPVHAHRHRY